MKIDEILLSKNGWDKFLFILGGICFVAIPVSVILHLGFIMPQINHNPVSPDQFLDPLTVLIINIGIGLLGGILVDSKNLFIAGVSGGIASILMTGTSLLYFFWREEAMMIEIIIPMLTGLLGKAFYNYLIHKKNSK